MYVKYAAHTTSGKASRCRVYVAHDSYEAINTLCPKKTSPTFSTVS